MKSNSKIEKQLQKKTNMELVRTIISAKKNQKWKEVAEILSGPRKNRRNVNLEEIEKNAKDNEKIVVPGKILSQGELTKKLKIIALNFSEVAKEKLKKSGCEVSSIIEEIKRNPEAKDLRILK